MPKGFNQKAVRGFMQWASQASGTSETREPQNWVFRTRKLLEEGFPNTRVSGQEHIKPRNIEIGRGYDRAALAGLLNFLEATYEQLLDDVKSGVAPLEAIKGELKEISLLRERWLCEAGK